MTHPETDRGAVLLLVALSMVTLLGMAALAIDASFAYDIRNRLGAVADAAAKSAAYEIWRGNSTGWGDFAYRAIDQEKATGTIPQNTTAIVRRCTDVGATCLPAHQFPTYVEVILQSTYLTFFGGVLNQLSLSPANRAVAGSSDSPYCLITLSGTPSLEIGNADLTLNGCAVEAGGPINGTNPNANIDAAAISTTDTCTGHCDHLENVQTNAPAPVDPLAGKVPTPPACTPAPFTLNANGTWPAGCYSNVTLDAPTVTLTSGDYVITGQLWLKNNTHIVSGGTQQFLYFGPTATFDFDQNTSVQAVAQTSGSYVGIAVYIDPGNTSDWDMQNSSGIDITGAFYAPNTNVIVANGMGATSNCSVIVVRTLDVRNGNGQLANNCSAYPGSPLTSIALAE